MSRHRVWLALVVTASCRTTAAPPVAAAAPPTTMADDDTPQTPAIAPPWRLVVADGSANVYRCEHVDGGSPQLEYLPVTPETSSTGHYSGGPPRHGPLSSAQVEQLWEMVAALVADDSAHVEDRAKGTVAIDASGPTKASVIVSGKAGAALVEWLATLPAP
jgi:hypothetical protein